MKKEIFPELRQLYIYKADFLNIERIAKILNLDPIQDRKKIIRQALKRMLRDLTHD